MKKLRVIVANDHTLVSAAIRSFLQTSKGMEVLASVRIGPEARRVIARTKPDLLFLYLGTRGYDALEETEKLLKPFPKLPGILLSLNNSDEYVAKALRTGVRAVLPQTAKPKDFEKAVRGVIRGNSHNHHNHPKTPFERLTARQRSVLKLVAEGNSTRQIAQSLKLSVKTIEFHRARLMDRLGIHHVAGLVRLAARVGLVSLDQ